MADLGQTDTAQRELASLREGTIQEDDGREGSEDSRELAQPEPIEDNLQLLAERVKDQRADRWSKTHFYPADKKCVH